METCQVTAGSRSVDLKTRVNHLESQLVDFEQVLEERDTLLQEVGLLKDHIEDLTESKEKLKEEHAEELSVLSSSFSHHFETQDSNHNEEQIKEYEREIQKLRNSIEDKTYHINQLQKKLMRTQVEMEKEMENHETELENLRSQLEKLENSDTESLVEERMSELKENYEKEIRELKDKLHVEEKDEQLSNSLREVDDLKRKVETLEEGMDERMEEEETKFRREVMAVKDKLIHQHQLEIEELLSQLERSNAEVEKLRRLSKHSEGDQNDQHVSNGDIASNNLENINGIKGEHEVNYQLTPVQMQTDDPKVSEELEHIRTHYQQQVDFMTKRSKEQYQDELDENLQKVEEDLELQFEKQRTEYEEKVVGVQRQLRTQHQSDLDRTTNYMEEQIQVLKNGHAEEIADLMQRLRGFSDERRRSYIEQDNTQQHVIVIKEEFKSKVESLEQELRLEREHVSEYQAKLQDVEVQVQAFKSENEREVKYIEEEFKKQCKALVEKKAKELKERYQSELNEKVTKVEKTLRKQYDEESVRTRCELEESHRTLKEKYDNEISDIMTQMEQVQQRNQEVFEAEQKEHFEKQLSLAKEQLEPYKEKYEDLQKENRDLLEKYNTDISVLKSKMDEVEERYSANDKIEEKLQQENTSLTESYEKRIKSLHELVERTRTELKTRENEVTRVCSEREDLNKIVDELSRQLETYINNCAELEETKKALDNRHAEEIHALSEKMSQLDKDLEYSRHHCNELENVNTAMEKGHYEETDDMIRKITNLQSELDEMRNQYSQFQHAKKNSVDDFEETEKLTDRIHELEQQAGQRRGSHDDEVRPAPRDSQQVQKLTDKITQLEKSVKEFRNNYNELEEVKKEMEIQHVADKEDLVSKIEKQSAIVQEREKDIENVTHEKEKLKGDLRKVAQELENSATQFEGFKMEKEAVISEQSNEIKTLGSEIDKLKAGSGLENESVEMENLIEENKSLKDESSRLKVYFESLRAENSQLLEESKVSAERSRKRVSELDEELKSQRELNTKQSKNLDNVKERYELLIADLKDEIETHKDNSRQFELTNDQYVDEIASLLAEIERIHLNKETNPTENTSNSSEENSNGKQNDESHTSNSPEENSEELIQDEIARLCAENDQYKVLIRELEDEGDNKFGVLLSQHEKELEVLKEELEEQIARKREQLAKEAAAKRQKLKEEYEIKLRVIYDELVSERSRSKEQIQQINQLSQKVNLLEGISTKQKKDIERVRQMEEKLKELERQAKQKVNDVENKEDDYKTNIQILQDKMQELCDQLILTKNDLEGKDQQLNEMSEKVKSLQEELDGNGKENKKLGNLTENRELIVSAVAINELQAATGGSLDNEVQIDFEKRIKELETEKAKQDKEVQEVNLYNQKLKKDLQNMDKARQAVVQMYDEKIEALGIGLDDANERCDVVRKQLEEIKKMLRRKEKELEVKVLQLNAIEGQLKTEQNSVEMLKQKAGDHEETLSPGDRDISMLRDNEHKEVLEKLTSIETDLLNEKELSRSLKQQIQERDTEIQIRSQELVEVKAAITEREEELSLEKEKSSNLEKKLNIIRDSQSSDALERFEQVNKDLIEQHEKDNERLKGNYESILERRDGENRLKAQEFEAEIMTLKGMVDDLEQLGLLKDEDRELHVKEMEERHDVAARQCQDAFDNETKELKRKMLEVAGEESQSQRAKLEDLSLQVCTLSEESASAKKSYENEIKTLKKQLDFENAFQVELQDSFQNELKATMDKQEQLHKQQIERVNGELQQKIKELDTTRTEHSAVVRELEVSRQNAQTSSLAIHNLEGRLMECKARHEEEVLELTSKLETLGNNDGAVESSANDELIVSLRNDNKGLIDEVLRLKEEIEKQERAHQEDIGFVTSELEMRFQQQRNELNRCHSGELDGLMRRLETLVRQENDSKALTQSHMHEIDSVRNEMGQRIEQLTLDKEREIEATRRALDEHYRAKLNELQDHFDSKCREVLELQKSVRSLKSRAVHDNPSMREELTRLRHENAELYRKLRERTTKQGQSADSTERIDNLKVENRKLKQDIENLKSMAQRPAAHVPAATETAGDGGRLLQLMKLMEQLMTEKNGLEMKLREEILDLKTRFGAVGDASMTSSSQGSLSPEKVSRESLLNTLQDLRTNKKKQEEDIQVHIREIEKMIEDIRVKIKSTEFADVRIQEMLAHQMRQLEEQRRLLVSRLWKLREKHDNVEQKLTQEIGVMSTPTSPREDARSKWYQNLLEENLRKEKDLLLSKRQQVNDLQSRLSLEKSLMDRKVAERQMLRQQLSDKDRRESELSTERNELERKWIDKLREKEMEMKQDQVHFHSQSKMIDSGKSVASRISGLISRSSDDKTVEKRPVDYSPLTAIPASVQQSLNRYQLARESRKDRSSEPHGNSTAYTHFRPYEQEKTGYQRSATRGLSDRVEFQRLPNEVAKPEYRNGLSSDEEYDNDLEVPSDPETLYWDMDHFKDTSDDDDSHDSASTLEGMEKDWENNLEKELKQISAGTLRVLPSGKCKEVNSRQTATFNKPGIAGSDLVYRPVSGYTLGSLDGNSSRSLEKSHRYPRSSTAIPGDEHEEWLGRNGSINVSQIPTLSNDYKLKASTRRQHGNETQARTQDDHQEPSPDSPNSSKSEPIPRTSRTNKSSSNRAPSHSLADSRDHSMYLLNIDDYIDRYQVLSSDKVASLRDLSPSERYSFR